MISPATTDYLNSVGRRLFRAVFRRRSAYNSHGPLYNGPQPERQSRNSPADGQPTHKSHRIERRRRSKRAAIF
ncbi:unnamed protein product, partial [Trichogramma brassicae]